MAEYQYLARILVAAGGAVGLDGEGTYFLSTDDGNLSLKIHTGEQWGNEEIVAEEVREGSPAAYILTPSMKLIVYIDSNSLLHALRYDADGEEWAEDTSFPEIRVHAEGNIAGCVFHTSESTEKMYIFYQDPSGSLAALDGTWKPSVLPVQPLTGTPLHASTMDQQTYVSYLSATDHKLHVLSEGAEGWADEVAANDAFSSALKRIVAIRKDTLEGEEHDTYVLTEDNAVVHVSRKGEVAGVGRVDEDGTYVPEFSAQNVTNLGLIRMPPGPLGPWPEGPGWPQRWPPVRF